MLNSSIKSLREAKSKNDTAIKERIKASEKSCDKVKKDLDNVQQIAEDRKSKLRQLLDGSKFEFIEVDDTTEENKNKLRKAIKKHENENNKQYFYITKGTKDRNTHWFLNIQQGQDVFVIDPLGAEARKDFYNLFVKDSDEYTHIHYFVNRSVLQISSGVCEIYAIKMAFYLLRAQLFNSISNRFDKFLCNRKNQFEVNAVKDVAADVNTLDNVLLLGMRELPFGQFKERIDRRKILQEQIKKLEKSKELIYGIDMESREITTFNSIFKKDLELAQKLFDEYKKPTPENLTEAMYTVYSTKDLVDKIIKQQPREKQQALPKDIGDSVNELVFPEKEQLLSNTIRKFLDLNDLDREQFNNVSRDKRQKVYEELFEIQSENKRYIDFDNFNLFFNTFDIVRNSQEVSKYLLKKIYLISLTRIFL